MTDLNRLKMYFGFTMLGGLLGLAIGIAFGHIEEKTSFGLREVIDGLLVISGAFSNWAFSGGFPEKGKTDEKVVHREPV